MRVLHVISGLDPENGGPTIALVGLAEAQVAAGLDVSVIATWQRTSGFPNAERMKAKGIHVRLVGQATGKLSRYPGLFDIVDDEVSHAEVVHIHALWEEIQHFAARAAWGRKVPYVVTPHGMLSPWSFSTNRLAKRVYFNWRVRPNLNHATAIHYTAEAERDLAARHRLRPRVILEPYGLDLAEFRELPTKGAFREKYPSLGEKPIVLFLSRLSPQKGLDLLIPAFAKFAATDTTGATLVLAGPDSGGYETAVRGWVKEHRLENRVLFTGILHGANRVAALRDAEILALPSRHENFGIVVAESLAAGTPVLISNEVNIWREIEAAGAGGVVEPNIDAVERGLRAWMVDANRRRTAGEKGRAFVFERYDWAKIARKWGEHYASMIRGL